MLTSNYPKEKKVPKFEYHTPWSSTSPSRNLTTWTCYKMTPTSHNWGYNRDKTPAVHWFLPIYRGCNPICNWSRGHFVGKSLEEFASASGFGCCCRRSSFGSTGSGLAQFEGPSTEKKGVIPETPPGTWDSLMVFAGPILQLPIRIPKDMTRR